MKVIVTIDLAAFGCTSFRSPEPENIVLPRDGHKLKEILDSAADMKDEIRRVEYARERQ